MMSSLSDAQEKLAELVALVDAGKEVAIQRDGKPVIVLATQQPRRRLGVLAAYEPLDDPDLYLRPDPEPDDHADGPVFPPE